MIITVHSNDDTLDWGVTGSERIAQNVLNVLRTRNYEVPFMRGLGLNPDFIDTDLKTMQSDFANHVIEKIKEGEDRATVLDVRIVSVDENGEFVIAVDLEV